MQIKILSSCGNTLLFGQTATLTVQLYDDNDNIINDTSTYHYVWKKYHEGREVKWDASGQTITIISDECGNVVYKVFVMDENSLTNFSGNLITDNEDNIYTAYFSFDSILTEIYNGSSDIPPYSKDLTIILASRNLKLLGQIVNIDSDSISYKNSLNAANELSFTVHKNLDNIIEPLWDKITDLKLAYVKELNQYYQISVTINDTSDDITKVISATSLCEAELSQKYIHNTEINTENDITRDDYTITKFYSLTDKKASLLDRILSFAPNYKIGHVDDTLVELQRSFSIDGTSIYDFLIGDCSEQFGCLFQFDSTSRTINVYDLYTNCLNPECGYRGEFNDTCPECGNTNLSYFGKDTSIYIDKDNLTNSIEFTTDINSVKNCFKVVGGDDDINAAIHNVNPNGSDIIYRITDEQKDDMSSELVEKLSDYDELCDFYKSTYKSINIDIYNAMDKILYYTSSMMPTVEHEEVTASTEAAKLTSAKLSPLGLQKVTTSTSVATVNTALKMLARVFVKSGYVKVEVDTDNTNTFTYVGIDEQHNHYGTWYGRFKVTNYSNEEDIVYTNYMEIKVYDLYEEYLDQKIKKNIVSNDKDGEGNLFNVLSIEDLSQFKNALTYYCLNRLTSFYSAIEGCMNILIEADQAKQGADLYEKFYLKYYNMLQACQDEIDTRNATITEWNGKYDSYVSQRNIIQDKLNFEKYLGKELYNEFISYIREDTYTNDNYISDGLTNEELLNKAEELLNTAKLELFKSSERQHSISSTLYNLLQMKEFSEIIDKFQLGNWIRVKVDNNIYRLRLVSYEVNNSGIENINVEFSDVTQTLNGQNDTKSIISKAQQMATNYSYVSTQAKKGEQAQNSIASLLTNGFNTAITAIKNADTEDIIINKNGISARALNDIESAYEPKQLKIIHNMIVFTEDNWLTASTAIGEIKYTLDGQEFSSYGIIAKSMISGIIIAGHIYSANYSSTNKTGTHIDLDSGSFSLAGDKIIYSAGGNKLTLKDVLVEYTTEDDKGEKTQIVTGLDTVAIKVDTINSKYISTDNFSAKFAEIDIVKINELYANSAFITSLNSYTSNSINSTVNTEFVKTLIAGHATLNDLFTSNFTIGSDDCGSVLMNGSTMQFKDKNGNVYVQIGTDKSGGYSIIINDSNGTAIMNGSGITANAIADGLIVDKMVKKKDTTYNGISGDKLNIDSVVTSINEGNKTIKSSLIYFDEDKQTLDTKLGKMIETDTTINNSLNTIKNSVNENTSAITQVTMSANGNNLLRNSDTLIFDEYIIGSKLIDASNNILVDRNGYILVG